MKNKVVKIVWVLLVFVLVVIGIGGNWLFFSSFDRVRPVMDQLAPDNQLEFFTESYYLKLRAYCLIASSVSILLFLFLVLAYKKCQDWLAISITTINHQIRRLGKDKDRFFMDCLSLLRDHKANIILGIFILIGILLRVPLLSRPMGHDESYTFIAYVSRGLKIILRDYRLPNNQILHTLLVFLSYKILGSEPWMLRFPSFLSSVLLIPAIYLASRQYFNKTTGIISAGWVSALPVFTDYGTNGRGYALLALLSVLIWLLAGYIKKKRNLFAWCLFIGCSAAGFYTIPIMVYPFGMVIMWMLISWLARDSSQDYRRGMFPIYIALSILFTMLLSTLLYSPAIIFSGLDEFIGNNTVAQLKDPNITLFFEHLVDRFSGAWEEWFNGVGLLGGITLISFVIALLFHKQISENKVNLGWVGGLFLGGVLWEQKTIGWVRVWFFLAPFYLSFAAAGIYWFIRWITFHIKQPFSNLIRTILWTILVLSAFQWVFSSDWREARFHRIESRNEFLVGILVQLMDQDDKVITSSPDTPAQWYYATQKGITLDQFDAAAGIYDTIFVVVDLNLGQTMESVLREFSGLNQHLDITSSVLVFNQADFEIYKFNVLPATN